MLWAISPEGQTERLGEVITNHKDDAKLDVSTSPQTFGLLVTAEPYFAVSKPSPVVVMGNVLRPDTIGASEPVSAKYELLPRAETYTVNLQPPERPLETDPWSRSTNTKRCSRSIKPATPFKSRRPKVSTRAQGTLEKAEHLAQQAEQIPDRKNNSERVIMLARQAVQTAEDARNIAAHDK